MLDNHKHFRHSTGTFWPISSSQSFLWQPLTTWMPLRMFHECLGVVNAVPGEQGVCLGCLGVVFYCLGVFWGLLEGVSVLSEVSGSAFYSNLIYINCALIKSLTFSKRRGGPRCPKYQNVPTSWSFWPIGNPWERFQSWDIRVYFIPVPDDHTVAKKLSLSVRQVDALKVTILT